MGAYVAICSMCGCRYLAAERELHDCSGEIKVRDIEIARLKAALESLRYDITATLDRRDPRDTTSDSPVKP